MARVERVGDSTLTQRLEPPKTWVAFWVDVSSFFGRGTFRFQKKMPGEVAVCGANCGHHQDEPQTQDLFGPWNKSRKHGLVAEVVMNESHETSQTRWSRKEHWSLVG